MASTPTKSREDGVSFTLTSMVVNSEPRSTGKSTSIPLGACDSDARFYQTKVGSTCDRGVHFCRKNYLKVAVLSGVCGYLRNRCGDIVQFVSVPLGDG